MEVQEVIPEVVDFPQAIPGVVSINKRVRALSEKSVLEGPLQVPPSTYS